jgi:protein tyrosine/serine phosphatase
MNFAKVSDALYRGGQPDAKGFAALGAMGARTVVSLRTFDTDRSLLRGLGMQYIHISFKAGHPEDEDVVAFLKVVGDPSNEPVFVHCNWGTDRCGMMTAVYRVVVEGWDRKRALDEMHAMGFNEGWGPIERYIGRLDVAALKRQVDAAPAPKLTLIP